MGPNACTTHSRRHPSKTRTDAVRNQPTLLTAAAEVFVASGVDAPIREIATKAGVGLGTLYCHFPRTADLVIDVYRHQVEACAEAGTALLAGEGDPPDALRSWFGLFVDFLVTKPRTCRHVALGHQRLQCTPHVLP
jgi:AcrR family transcriptional regulator